MEIKAGQFKAKCLELMDLVANRGEEIVITKRGKPVAKLVAVENASTLSPFGFMRGTVEIIGDILAPSDED
jgi:prevent-host-death family protein